MDNINEIKDAIDNIEDIHPDEISVDFISNSNNKQSKLINNSDDTFRYKLVNKSYDFQLKEPLYIEKISLKSENDDLENTVLEVLDYFTDEKIRIPIVDYKKHQYVGVKISRVIKSFTLKPPKRFLKIKLKSIELFGYPLTELKDIETTFKKIEGLKQELADSYLQKVTEIDNKTNTLNENTEKTTENLEILETAISEKKSEISDLSNELIELKSSIKSNNDSSEKLKGTVSELELSQSNLSKSLTDIKNSIQQREEESASLNKKISNEKDILKKNENDNNLFAYELSEFLKEGSANIKLYTFISILPMALIFFLTYVLLNGTVELTTIYSLNKDMDISIVFWSRLPFVLVITSIIFVCYEVTKIFFKKVMEIHHQKLNFSKIGIIAKDVATSSFDGLDLDDNEKSELQTKLKMQLLREYLSREFHIEHDYNINKSLWTRFLEWRKEKDKKIIVEKSEQDIEDDK